jgi:hypothetical protein
MNKTIETIKQVSNSNCKREAISDVVSIMTVEGLTIDQMIMTRPYYFDFDDKQQQEPQESYDEIMKQMEIAADANNTPLYRQLRAKLKSK